MKKHLRLTPVLLLAALLAGCQGPCKSIGSISGPALTSGSADFTTVGAVGTSISAGYQSGGIVDRHQIRAFPALFAQQVGKTVLTTGAGSFSIPAVSSDGIAPLLKVKSFVPLVLDNVGRTLGSPVNIGQLTSYHNLGVPGSLAFDFADTSAYHSAPNAVGRTNFTMFNIVQRGMGSLAAQLLRLNPTFISFEYGANEVLGSATSGVSTLTFPAASYAAILTGGLNAIHATLPNAKLALFNVPSVTTVPFFTTFRSYTVNATTHTPLALIGPSGDLAANDLVLLTAKDSLAIGTGFAVGAYNYLNPTAGGNGRPLRNSQVLDVAEQTAINGVITAMNAAVDSVSTRPWVTKVDLQGLLGSIATSGYQLGSVHYTSAFITGGLFSLDGVHPNDLAHALICNTMIDAVNGKFGATVPRVNPADHASATASAARPATPEDLLNGMQVSGLEDGFRMIFPGFDRH